MESKRSEHRKRRGNQRLFISRWVDRSIEIEIFFFCLFIYLFIYIYIYIYTHIHIYTYIHIYIYTYIHIYIYTYIHIYIYTHIHIHIHTWMMWLLSWSLGRFRSPKVLQRTTDKTPLRLVRNRPWSNIFQTNSLKNQRKIDVPLCVLQSRKSLLQLVALLEIYQEPRPCDRHRNPTWIPWVKTIKHQAPNHLKVPSHFLGSRPCSTVEGQIEVIWLADTPP